ncbi:MAG: hypothetical protein WD000_08220 [Thermodesulfobacteriota bacterium]
MNTVDLSTFTPVKSLEGKKNYKRYIRIERDGTDKEIIFLHVPDISLREEIICKHYLSFLAKNFISETIGFNIVDRDNPWDFVVESSNSMRFNVEITSIADNEWFYEKTKREEEFERIMTKETISLRGHDLKKVYRWFGQETDPEIIKLENEAKTLDDLVKNPLYGAGGHIFVSDTKAEEESLTTLILKAIRRKSDKNHKGKENTVLIIDNRTTRFELSDYEKSMEELEDSLVDVIFPEIYFYTGYYSDDDGSNAECSFAPIKWSDKKHKKFISRIESGALRLDKKGIAYD